MKLIDLVFTAALTALEGSLAESGVVDISTKWLGPNGAKLLPEVRGAEPVTPGAIKMRAARGRPLHS